MTLAGANRRGSYVAGTALGLYGAAIALTPDPGVKALLCLPMPAIPFCWWLLGDASRWLSVFFVAAWLLPPLPIALGNSGPHVALLFAAAGLWIGLIRLAEWRFRADSVSAALLALLFFECLSLPLALLYSGPSIAAASTVRVLLFGISVYVYLFVRCGPGVMPMRLIRVLFRTATGAAAFACLDFYFQFSAPAGYGAQFIWLDSGVFRRAQGFFYEASTLGNFCTFFIVMIGVALLQKGPDRLFPVWALLGGGAVLLAALLLSYSRGSLVNLGVALAVFAWLQRSRMRLLKVALIAAGAGAAALTGLYLLLPDILWAYGIRIWSSAEYFLESPNSVLSGRIQSWSLLIDFLHSHPWHALLGVGYKTLPYSDFIGMTAIADNTYLSMLIETGVGGLIALLALNLAILTTSYRTARSTNALRAFLGTWIFCFWCGQTIQMFSGDLLTYWRVMPAFVCILAMGARE